MQTIATKLTAVKTIKQAADWSDQELRSLIHGVGGSPRRAKRMLRSDQVVAKMLAEAYANAIAEGTHHVKAVQACNAMYLTLVPPKAAAEADDDATEASEAGEGESEAAEAAEAAAAAWANGDKTVTPAAPVRRVRKAAPVADASALKALLQPALL